LEQPSHVAVLAELDQEQNYLNSRDYHDFAMQEIGEQKRLVKELGIGQLAQ
jgi:hypothetical protein